MKFVSKLRAISATFVLACVTLMLTSYGAAVTTVNVPSGGNIATAVNGAALGTSGPCTNGVRTVSNAGICVLVADGNFVGPITITKTGTATQRVVILSATRFGAKITNPELTYNANFVDWMDFDMTAPNDIFIQQMGPGASFNTFQYNYVHDVLTSSCHPNGVLNDIGSSASPASHNTYNGNILHHWGTTNTAACTPPQVSFHGIYADGAATVITNNVFSGGSGGWAIQKQYTVGASGATCAPGIIANNTIFNNQGGIVINERDGSGAPVSCSFAGWSVINNIIVNNGVAGTSAGTANYGIDFFRYNAGNAALFSNNMIYGNLPADIFNNTGNTPATLQNPKTDSGTGVTFANFRADVNSAPVSNYNVNDYKLKAGSAAVQGGGTGCASGGLNPCVPTTDFTGATRNNSPPSLGAFDTGASPVPHITISPSTKNFGNQSVNSTSTPQAFNLLNDGTANLVISSIGATGDFLESNSCFTSTLTDTFSSGTLNAAKWQANTGNIGSQSLGTASTGSAANVDLTQGVLGLKLTQATAGNSVGAEVQSLNTFGYGIYDWTMRSSSTATTPNGAGSVTSGQISSGFTFINNSQTEIDFEIEGQRPNVIEMTSWNGVGSSEETEITLPNPEQAFHHYTMNWQPGRIDFYVDGVWASTHTTVVPSAPAFILLNHWGTNSSSFGGFATVGVTRWVYFSGFTFTPTSGTLAPGFSCNANVSFKPSSIGAKTGTLNVIDNATGSPHTSSLSGTGTSVPNIGASPALLSFGNHTTSTNSSLPITIQNTGTAPLVISGVSVNGTNPSQFSQTNTCGTVAPAGSCTITATFSPTSVASFAANIAVVSNDPDTPTLNIPLSGNGTAPAQTISVTPTSLGFGSVAVGSSSSLPLTVKNIGGSTLTVSGVLVNGVNASQFSQSNACSTLIPNATCTVSVSFSPLSAANFTANVQISSNDPINPTVNVGLTGTGIPTAPLINFSATTLDFGSVPVGTANSPQTLTITNTGNANLVISAKAFTSPDYVQTGGTCGAVPITITSGLNCTVFIQFTPSATGPRNGSLNLTHNAAGSPSAISLTGIGTAPAVSFSPTTATFGNQPIGSTSNPITVTLTNTGTAPLGITLASFAISGANASDFTMTGSDCPSSLAPSGPCSFVFTFHPATAGNKVATFSFTTSIGSQTIPLSGNGSAQPHITPPSSLAFGSHAIGTSTSLPLNITNSGNADLSISGVSITGTNGAQFSQTNSCGTVHPGSTCVITATFSPTIVGLLNANVQVVSNDPSTPTLVVPMSGTGTVVASPIISASSLNFNFGSVLVGTNSAFQTLTVSNIGTADLIISAKAFTNSEYSEVAGGSCTPLPVTVTPGSNCTIRIQFSPTATGTRNGLLNITSNASGTVFSISLTGVGQSPAVSFLPPGLNFGNQTTSTTSGNSSVTLTNAGTSTLTINVGSFALTGTNASDFTFVSTTCTSSLPATNTCTFTFNFHPATAGGKNASFSMVDSAPGSPHVIALTGTGVNSPTGVTVIIGGVSIQGGVTIQ